MTPNQTTQEAMRESEEMEGRPMSVEELLAELDEEEDE